MANQTMPMSSLQMVQNWSIGDTVIANVTDFRITKGTEYEILKRDVFHDCFFIHDDTGALESYSEEYFDLVIPEKSLEKSN